MLATVAVIAFTSSSIVTQIDKIINITTFKIKFQLRMLENERDLMKKMMNAV
ncbi:hypothetical protein SMUE_00940 [Enterococcus cecorum]